MGKSNYFLVDINMSRLFWVMEIGCYFFLIVLLLLLLLFAWDKKWEHFMFSQVFSYALYISHEYFHPTVFQREAWSDTHIVYSNPF